MRHLDISIRQNKLPTPHPEWIWIVKESVFNADGSLNKVDEFTSKHPLPYPYLVALDLCEFLKVLELNPDA